MKDYHVGKKNKTKEIFSQELGMVQPAIVIRRIVINSYFHDNKHSPLGSSIGIFKKNGIGIPFGRIIRISAYCAKYQFSWKTKRGSRLCYVQDKYSKIQRRQVLVGSHLRQHVHFLLWTFKRSCIDNRWRWKSSKLYYRGESEGTIRALRWTRFKRKRRRSPRLLPSPMWWR